MQRGMGVCRWAVVLVLVLSCVVAGAPQGVNTATLLGTVIDQQGQAVEGAKVTLTSTATGAERTAVSEDNGRYTLVGIPPGQYKMTVDGGANFDVYVNPSILLTVGEAAKLDAQLRVHGQIQTVMVVEETALVETQKADVSATVTSVQINNLPINERNYINFTLLDSQASRDQTPSIGAAPTSGLNFGGQRGRSNEVSVDGADAVDKSVGGVRATVSQEAVKEFRVITSNYMPEYGRATGGVVNIVTKSGSNQLHGNLFGFLRNGAIQAQNPFSVQGAFDPATDTVTLKPVKQSFTRVGNNNFGLVPVPGASVCSATPLLLTGGPTGQAAFYPAAIAAAGGCGSAAAGPFITGAALSGGASAVALFGNTGALPTSRH